MYVDRSQRGRDDLGLRGIVKAAQIHILRNRVSQLFQHLQHIQSGGIIGAQKHLRKRLQLLQAFGEILLIILRFGIADPLLIPCDAVFVRAGETQKLQGIPVSHIPLEEGTAVQIFPDKSDPGLSTPGHFLYK